METGWLEQTEADVPATNDWLGGRETGLLSGMRFAKRRTDWRLGRWTPKHAVAAYLNLPANRPDLAAIEILPAASGAPEVFVAEQRAAVTISLSHRGGVAVCAIAGPGVALGCDIEIDEPRSDAFAADYFTAAEQSLVSQACVALRPAVLALLWSAKESVLKALTLGLREDPRCVAISVRGAVTQDGEWRPLEASYAGETFQGWWRRTGTVISTLVARPAEKRAGFCAPEPAPLYRLID
jgi:4'-phosphopantetheinyl transferase